MALDFTGMDSDVVNHGSDSSLDNLPNETNGFTFLMWLYSDVLDFNAFNYLTKVPGIGVFHSHWVALGDITFTVDNATHYVEVSATILNTGKWECFGAWIDPSLSSNYGEVYYGDLTTNLSSQSLSWTDRGTPGADDSGNDLLVGNNSGGANSVNGKVGLVAVWAGKVPLANLIAQQYSLSPVYHTGLRLFSNYFGTGVQADWSGNGNNGTVTGATVAPHVPLPVFPPTPYMLPVRHPKGAWSQVCASTPYDVAGMLLSVNADGNGGNSSLIDIGIGSANNEKVLAEDILVGQKDDSGVTLHQVLPLHIKEGERVSVRGSTNAASKNMYPQLTFFANSFMAEQPFARATTYGADSYNSKGTTVDPGGTVNTKGAWSELTPSTNVPMKALILFASNNQSTDTTATRQAVDIGIGAEGSEKVLIPNIQLGVANEHTVSPSVGPFRVDLPAGTRIAVRSQSNNTTSGQREWDCVIVGLD